MQSNTKNIKFQHRLRQSLLGGEAYKEYFWRTGKRNAMFDQDKGCVHTFCFENAAKVSIPTLREICSAVRSSICEVWDILTLGYTWQ